MKVYVVEYRDMYGDFSGVDSVYADGDMAEAYAEKMESEEDNCIYYFVTEMEVI